MPPDRKTGLVGAERRRERVRLPARRVAWTPGRLPRADVLTASMIRKKPAPHLMRGGYRFERPELSTTNRSCRDCLRGGNLLTQALGQPGRHGDGKKCWIGLP